MRPRLAQVCCALSILVLILPIGCVDYNKYAPCDTDAECEDDQFCYAGLCRDLAPCEQDTDCPAGQVCLAGNCLPPDCVQDNDCPDGQRCVEHTCTACACLTDADCQPEDYCLDACVCVERPVLVCANDRDCPPDQRCVDGACQPRVRCAADQDCPAGMVCEAGTCIEGCGSDADCPQLYSCADGRCRQTCLGDQFCLDQDLICENGLCVPAECTVDGDCPGDLVRCQNGRCESYTACEHSSDCGDPNWVCIEGICEELPTCAIDQNCAPGELCLDGHCHLVDSCQAEVDCDETEDCVGGLCVPHICRGPDDCAAGLVCVGGACVEPGNPARVYEVIVLTPGGPIHQGQRIQLTAIALTQSGEAVPGVSFEWSSSVPARAAVDAGGVLTGGDEAGDTQVRAKATGTNRESRPVTFTNLLAPQPDTLRVTALASPSRAPLAGVQVLLVRAGQQEWGTTGPDGTASFPAGAGPADLHLFAAGRDAVSILQTSSHDLLVPLPPRSDPGRAGGFTGQMTFGGLGGLSLGLAGLSVGEDLLRLDFASLFGDVWQVPVALGNYAFDLPLPARMALGLTFQGIPIEVKPGYNVVGQAGLRTAWAFGGNLELAVLGQLFGGASLGDVLGSLLPYFSLLDHGIKPVQDVHPLPLVVDSDDLDRDGDSAELRPDWANFPDVDLAPGQPQTLALVVSPPPPPRRAGQPVDSLLVVAGGLGELGLTPLGLSSAQAAGDQFEPVWMRMAPAHGGLEVGGYAVVALALPGTATLSAPTDAAAVIRVGGSLPAEVQFETGFLAFPEDAVFHRPTRTLLASGVVDADVLRLTLLGPQGGWTIWIPAHELVQASLPQPPAGLDDPVPGAQLSFTAIRLEAGLGFEQLVTFNGDDLDQLSRLARAYSRMELD